MFEATIAGSLPKPGWLAETDKLWPQWKLAGAELAVAKRDATLLWLKEQEDAGLDIVGDGEQSRQHFVHGFLEFVDGIDFEHKVEMGIRKERYKAMVPQVIGPLRLKGRVHQTEATLARRHTTKKLKITLPGPMTIVDTVADRHYGDKVKLAMAFAELLNQEARALQKDGVDVIQFDEPAFNVYMSDVTRWGIDALHRAAQGLKCTTCVHICYGYGIQANIDWKKTLGESWRQYEQIFPALAKSTTSPGSTVRAPRCSPRTAGRSKCTSSDIRPARFSWAGCSTGWRARPGFASPSSTRSTSTFRRTRRVSPAPIRCLCSKGPTSACCSIPTCRSCRNRPSGRARRRRGGCCLPARSARRARGRPASHRRRVPCRQSWNCGRSRTAISFVTSR